MAIARGISETSIVFDGNNGHNHDGTAENGSLIDTSKYSIYDFSPTKINTADNQRSIRQDNNINAFNNKVAEIVNTLVLRPAGIILQEETLNGNYIIANTVTSSQIAANTITASEIAANTITTNELTSDVLKSSNYSYTSGNFSNAGTFFDLSDGSIISKNFAIDSSGNAYFTGAVNATSGTFSGSISSTATISGGTLSGATITGSTLTAGNPSGDGVTINGTRVLINTTGGSGSGAARLKFNTNASSGDNFIESDKRLVLTAGGGGYTKILVGSQTGSAQDVVNVEATDLQLNGTSVLTSGSLPSGTIWTSNNDGAGSGLHADLLDGYHASDFILNSSVSGTIWTSTNDGAGSGLHADKLDGYHASDFALDGHNHSGVYSTTSHLHDSRYELLGHTHNYLSTVSGGTVYGSVSFTSSSIYMSGLPSGFSGYVRWDTSNGRLQRSTSLRSTKTDVYSIGEILEYLDEVNPVQNLRPVIFKSTITEEPDDAKPYNYGFIAEEVVDELPEASLLGPDGELVMYDIDVLAPLLTAEIQRLSKMVEELYKQANPDWTPPRERGVGSKQESLIDIEAYKNWILTREEASDQALN